MSPSPRPDREPTAVARAAFSVPPQAVWQYRLDFTNLPQYNPDVSDVARVQDGDPGGVGGVRGPGARYTFRLADPREPGKTNLIELWAVDAVDATFVSAGMNGGTEAYEEFTIDTRADGGCEATLSLWLMLPDGLADDMAAAAAAGSLAQIEKEMRLMKENLERSPGGSAR
jgi:Polyketide cyclase / dehydrase and lipid transport